MALHHYFLADFVKKHNIEVMAEIGVWKGGLIKTLTRNCKDVVKEYYAIDPWQVLGPEHLRVSCKPQSFWDSWYENTCGLKKHFPQLTVLRTTSLEAAKTFNKHYFDFVYIDQSHFYEDVKSDIITWLPLIKPGRFIGGHDYESFRTVHQGATKAVNEMFPEDKIQTGPDTVWYVQL